MDVYRSHAWIHGSMAKLVYAMDLMVVCVR